jgi:hypothetical protein
MGMAAMRIGLLYAGVRSTIWQYDRWSHHHVCVWAWYVACNAIEQLAGIATNACVANKKCTLGSGSDACGVWYLGGVGKCRALIYLPKSFHIGATSSA